MITKIDSKIFGFVLLFVFVLFFSPVARDFFTAKISNVSVYVPSENPPSVPPGGGGSYYYPTIIVPETPPKEKPILPVPPVVENPEIQPAEELITKIQEKKPEVSATNLLPLAVANLSQKIPQFATILSNLNVKNATDVAGLQNYNIFLPGLREITKTSQMPSDMVFVLLGKKNIDALTRLDFSENASALQTINVLPAKNMYLVVRPSLPAKEVFGFVFFEPANSSDASQKFSVLKFNYINNNDGTFFADINSPAVAGRYQIVSSIIYADDKIPGKDIKITTLVDPDGYVYEKVGEKELRINNATVSLYSLNNLPALAGKKEYELWRASEFGQENPQITGPTGNYSFLVPAGTYYLTVKAPGYHLFQSDAFSVIEGKEVHTNISLRKEFDLYSFLNIDTLLIMVLFLLVGVNFYKDIRRENLVHKIK